MKELTLQERISIYVETNPDFVLVPSHRFLDTHDIPRYSEEEYDSEEELDIFHSALCIVLESQLGFPIETCDIITLEEIGTHQELEVRVKLLDKDEWIPVIIRNVTKKDVEK